MIFPGLRGEGEIVQVGEGALQVMEQHRHSSLEETRKEVDTKRTPNEHILHTLPGECSEGSGVLVQLELEVGFGQIELTKHAVTSKGFQCASDVWNLEFVSSNQGFVEESSVQTHTDSSDTASIVFLRGDYQGTVVRAVGRSERDIAGVQPAFAHLGGKWHHSLGSLVLRSEEAMSHVRFELQL